MNIFRSHDPNAAEVVKIPAGQLFLTRTESVRGGRECLYNDAMATIRRVPSMEHTFQLVITRVYEDGDQELLEDEEETDEERVFLICDALEFRSGKSADNEPAFIWRDVEGDEDELFEFVAAGTNEPTRAFFETCMYRAMYEIKYRASADNVLDSELQQFIWQPPATKKSKKTSQGQASRSTTTAVEETPTEEEEPEPVATSSGSNLHALAAHEDPSMPSIFSGVAELHLWDPEQSTYEKEADVVVRIAQNTARGQYYYQLVALDEHQRPLVAQDVTTDMNARLAARVLSFTWNQQDSNGIGKSWCVRFEEEEPYKEFTAAFARALWEGGNQLPWAKAKFEDQNYVMSSNAEDVEMRDVEDDEDEEDAVAEELDKSDEEEEEEEFEEEEENPLVKSGGRNTQLAVGYKGDRSYVVRGDKIGVFAHMDDHNVRYSGTISKLATPKGKALNPKHAMLHDQDTKMILQSPNDPHALFHLDIETGKIVEEWKVHDDIQVDHIAPDNKFAQMTPEQTVVGISHNALFRIDPRVSGTKLVDSQYKQYAGKNAFSGVTTTESGKLAVASTKGDIRLFDSIGKNAKTALPPLGDPIVGIDVTADGRWLVATTKTYLLLIDTLIGEGRYTGQLGFDRSFPADAKPIPRRLTVRPEHVQYMGGSVSFTPARFNMGSGKEENTIVTSSGQYVIAWDFKRVKKGNLDKYEIKQYEEQVVQDNFKFNDDKQIIVALTNNVHAMNKKQLQRPTRTSLAPSRSSRSGIVNSPY
ncbi:VID27 cytoplasmic protein [Epithele typhae]|uniref:VID27 cytoplasmic protein n=1 Tax=Epithele typhae TaxID=378194 RepID=UPI002007BA7E|nr:VID27 cytoplasmic protein [Epithele typhae]KAH9943458.1 VID27 cytoplasmic protein [Epithele typhae]